MNMTESESASVVYVVDDDEAVRDSLQFMLEPNYHVECHASAESFLANYHPETIGCMILDVRMAGMSGLQLQDHLIQNDIQLPIIFITGHGDVPMAVSAIKKGAADFIEKPFDQEFLKSLVERMLVQARVDAAQAKQRQMTRALLSSLTAREQQVLDLIVSGRLNKQIADDLGISIKTVEAHRANIMDKLGAGTMADLMRIALADRQGTVEPSVS